MPQPEDMQKIQDQLTNVRIDLRELSTKMDTFKDLSRKIDDVDDLAKKLWNPPRQHITAWIRLIRSTRG